MMDDQIHWFSIINSLMIVLFLSGMVAMIMMRTLHRDISKYNQLETAEEAQEETGWKLVSPRPVQSTVALPYNVHLAVVMQARYTGAAGQCHAPAAGFSALLLLLAACSMPAAACIACLIEHH